MPTQPTSFCLFLAKMCQHQPVRPCSVHTALLCLFTLCQLHFETMSKVLYLFIVSYLIHFVKCQEYMVCAPSSTE